MKNISKRIFAMFLCVVMCVSMLPVSAFAEDDDIYIISDDDEIAEAEEYCPEEFEDPKEASEPLETEGEPTGSEDPEEAETGEEAAEIAETEETLEASDDLRVFEDENAVASGTCGASLNWSLSEDGTLTISGTGAMTDYGSGSNKAPWSTYAAEIESVIIESGATSIGRYAFNNCSALTAIEVGAGVTSIGNYAFSNCSQLASVSLPEGLTKIYDYAFSGCALLSELALPDSITTLGCYLLTGCPEIKEITLPAGLKGINNGSSSKSLLSGSSIEKAIVPAGMTALPNYTFSGSSTLKEVELPEGLKSVGSNAFSNCSELESVTLPAGVTKINTNAFYKCGALASVSLPEGLITIDDNAFSDCTSLTELVLPDSITTLGKNLLSGCTGIKEITLPAGLTKAYQNLDEGPFGGSSIEKAIVPAGMTALPGYTFSGASSLKEVVLQEGLTSVGNNAFAKCTSLTELVLPDSITTLGKNLLSGCTRIKEITLPAGLTKADQFNKNGPFSGSSIEKAIVPAGMTALPGYTFSGASTLKKVELPEGLKSVGSYAFYNCGSLTALSLPEDVTTIDSYAFSGCTALNSLSAPINMTIGSDAFYGINKSGTIGELSWTADLQTRTLTVSGTGEMVFDDTEAAIPWSGFKGYITRIVIEDGVTSIADNAFEGFCDVISMAFPDSVETIGSEAFKDCTALEIVEIPENLTQFGTGVFSGCGKLKLKVSGSVTITLDREYIAIDRNGTAQLTATVYPAVLQSELKWETLDENFEAGSDLPITVDENGLVSADDYGYGETAYAVAYIELGGVRYSAKCRVDVTKYTAGWMVDSVGLVQNSVDLKLYSTAYPAFDIILDMPQISMNAEENGGIAVTSAYFTDSKVAELFKIVVKDDRTLEVQPTEEALSSTAAFAKAYSSTVSVVLNGETFETAPLKLNVSTAMPKLKVTAVKFNPTDINNNQPVNISGAEISSLSFYPDTKPYGIDLGEDGMSLVLTDPAIAKSGKLSMKAELKGWTKPVDVTVSYSFAAKAPAIKLKKTSLTVLSGSIDSAAAAFSISPAEFLSDKYHVEVRDTSGGIVSAVISGRSVSVSAPAELPSAKALSYKLYLGVYNSEGTLIGKETALTVKVLPAATAVTVTAKAAGAIDTAIPNSPITLTATVKNLNASCGETYGVKIFNSKTGEAADSLFTAKAAGSVITVTQAPNGTIPAGTAYSAKVVVNVGGKEYESKAVKLGIKWSQPSKVLPSVTLKAAGSIDPVRPASRVTITPAVKNWYGFEPKESDLVIKQTLGKTVITLEPEDNPFVISVENGRYVITAKNGALLNTAAKFSVVFSADLNNDGTAETSKAAAISLKMGAAKFTQSTKAVTLIKNDRYYTQQLVITPSAGLSEIEMYALDAKSDKFFEIYYLGNGSFAVGFKDNAVDPAVKTSTAKISVWLKGNSTAKANGTISLKINVAAEK